MPFSGLHEQLHSHVHISLHRKTRIHINLNIERDGGCAGQWEFPSHTVLPRVVWRVVDLDVLGTLLLYLISFHVTLRLIVLEEETEAGVGSDLIPSYAANTQI